MYLYLIRHGDALPQDQDIQRSLSPKGNQEIAQIAGFLKKQKLSVEAIYHSHKARSLQTASIIAKALTFNHELQLEYRLDPDNNVSALCHWVDSLSDNSLLVGHLPNIELLTNYLLTDALQSIAFDFCPGAMVCLRKESTVWALAWFIKPDLI